ncbi:hypothetical protein HPB50_024871 [Hyalomma asiaticum]|uniref:Uncharacterized protein n=1 Tax=Hyalomma asiaticum TaxID=266040 RepID=A0ACB7RPA3_HYAAI|nr:hypothetical protein HPB50_024871 [Hyalomma asiaticum]
MNACSQTRALIEEYVKPRAEASGKYSTPKERIDYTLEFVIGRGFPFMSIVKNQVKGKTEEEFFTYLNLALSGCATNTVARKAKDQGYHYMINGGGRPLFEPLLSIADVAKFLTRGSVPSLKAGNTWESLQQSNASRIIKDDGSEVLEDGCVVAYTTWYNPTGNPGLVWVVEAFAWPCEKTVQNSSGRILEPGVPVAENHLEVLKFGPKFCMEPKLKPLDTLGMARNVARMAPEEDRRRCISECVEEITRWNPRSDRAAAKMEPIGRDLRDRNLKLLTADKEGFFVLLTEGQYEEKASAAIAKNFKQANVKTQKVKEQAKKLLEKIDMQSRDHSLDEMPGTGDGRAELLGISASASPSTTSPHKGVDPSTLASVILVPPAEPAPRRRIGLAQRSSPRMFQQAEEEENVDLRLKPAYPQAPLGPVNLVA